MGERLTIAELAEAVADGRSVDWAAVEAGASDAARAAIDRLKRIDQIAGRVRSPGGGAESGATVQATASDTVEAHRWGHLTILEKVGEGAFGEVFRAHDPKLARDVALKLLRAPSSAATDATSAIEEGRLLARIRHPNVVTVYGADRLDGRVGLWMEFVPGRTLEQELQDRGPFDTPEATRVGVDLARALAAVHAAGLVHRDVKAQNVMREADGRLVLMDFGTGREAAHATANAATDLAGTPLYVAPEVLQGEPATVRSDIYSLGVLLYHLVTGSYPRTADTLSNLIAAHRTQTRPSLGTARPDLPAAFVAVVEQATALDPGERYAGAREMNAALSRVPPATRPRSRRRWVAGGGVLAIAAAIGAILLITRPWSTAQPQAATSVRSDIAQAPTTTTVPISVPSGPIAPATPKPSAVKWVLIGAFENRTGDPKIDGAVEDVLERELVEAPYIRVASRARVSDALVLMREPENATLTPTIAREVCLRDGGIQVLITGRIDRVGGKFLLRAELVNPGEGSVIGPALDEAPNEKALPAAIRREALKVRAALGEHLDSIEASRLRLAHVTTPSMEALALYTQGMTATIEGDRDRPDLPLREQYFRQALGADPGFAAANLMLAFTLDAQRHNEEEWRPPLAKAVQLAATATQPERDLIVAISHYWQARHAAGEERRTEARLAAAAFERVLLADPANGVALTSLNSADGMAGITFNALEIGARAADVRPLNFQANIDASVVSMKAGNVRASDKYYRAALRVDPTNPSPWLRLFPAYKAWAEGNVQAASNELEKACAATGNLSASNAARLGGELTEMLLTVGRVRRATEIANAIPEDQRKQRVGAIGEVLELQHDRDGLAALLMPHLDEPMAWPLRDLWVSAGRTEEARHILEKNKSEDLSLNLHIAYEEGRYPEAVKAGRQYLESLNGARPSPSQIMTMARALRELGRPEEAINLLKPVSDLAPAVANGNWAGHQWLQLRADLAKLYRETNQLGKALQIEKDVLTRLAAADPDFPLLVELRHRPAR